MKTKTLFRWEQNPSGGDDGTMTMWPGTNREFSFHLDSFKNANAIGMAINGEIKEAREEARQALLAEIARLA